MDEIHFSWPWCASTVLKLGENGLPSSSCWLKKTSPLILGGLGGVFLSTFCVACSNGPPSHSQPKRPVCWIPRPPSQGGGVASAKACRQPRTATASLPNLGGPPLRRRACQNARCALSGCPVTSGAPCVSMCVQYPWRQYTMCMRINMCVRNCMHTHVHTRTRAHASRGKRAAHPAGRGLRS